MGTEPEAASDHPGSRDDDQGLDLHEPTPAELARAQRDLLILLAVTSFLMIFPLVAWWFFGRG